MDKEELTWEEVRKTLNITPEEEKELNLKKELTWDKFEKSLNLTPEEEEEIRFEEELIEMEIKVRESAKLSQRDLSEKTGIKQSAIARIERRGCSPTASTLIRLLVPMGYTLKIVPISNKKK